MDTDLIDRDGGDKDNTVLDRTCSDYKDKSVLDGTSGDDETLVQEGTSDREGSWLGNFPQARMQWPAHTPGQASLQGWTLQLALSVCLWLGLSFCGGL